MSDGDGLAVGSGDGPARKDAMFRSNNGRGGGGVAKLGLEGIEEDLDATQVFRRGKGGQVDQLIDGVGSGESASLPCLRDRREIELRRGRQRRGRSRRRRRGRTHRR